MKTGFELVKTIFMGMLAVFGAVILITIAGHIIWSLLKIALAIFLIWLFVDAVTPHKTRKVRNMYRGV